MRHGIIIRFRYEREDPRFRWRLSLFEAMVAPRFEKQTNQDFELWILCKAHHEEIFKARGYHTAPTLEALPRFDIQTRHDNDDFVSQEYVKIIQDEVEKRKNSSFLISFVPVKLDLWTLKRYECGHYGPERPSMFLSLYIPPQVEEYESIFKLRHGEMWKLYPTVVTIPRGECELVCHGDNMDSQIRPTDRMLA